MQRVISGLLDLIFLGLICGFFYIAFIHAYPLLTPDEGRYAGIAAEMLQSHQWITPRQDHIIFLDKPVLVYWLEMLSFLLLGTNELAARLVPLGFGILGVLLSYLAGRALYNRRTAYLASLILMSAPLYFFEAHYVNMDLAVAVLITGSLYFFIMAMEAARSYQRKAYLIGAYLFAGLAILTKGLIGLVFPCMIIGLWIVCLHQWSLIKRMALPMGIVMILLITLPWYSLVQHQNPGFFHYFFIQQQFQRYVGTGFNMRNPIYYYPAIIFVGMLPWTAFILQTITFTAKQLCRLRQARVEWFLSLWIGVILVFFSIPASKISSYILPVFPPIALLIARFFDQHWATLLTKKSTRYSAYFLSVLVLVLMIAGIGAQLTALPKTRYSWLLIGGLCLFLCVACLFAWRAKKLARHFGHFFLYLLLCSMLAYLTAYASLALYAPSIVDKKIAQTISKNLQAQGIVVAYETYLSNIPFYVHRPVYVVLQNWHDPAYLTADNWKSELAKGSALENNWQELWGNAELKTAWTSKSQVIVYLKTENLAQFEQAISPQYRVLAQLPGFIVLTQTAQPPEAINPLPVNDPHTSALPQSPMPESIKSSPPVSTK